MAPPEDPKLPGEEPGPTAGPGRFWQRYSGRANDPAEAENAAGRTEDMGGSERTREAHGDPGPPPPPHLHHEEHQCLDWCPICRGADLLRTAVPPELQEQFQIVQRDALLFAQAMIQAHLERLQREGRDDDPDISSIPID